MQKAFSIKDSKAEVYNPPFFKPTHGEAERTFRELANDEKTNVNKYPEDFSLWYVGNYNEQTGILEPKEPTHLHNAISMIAPKPQV